MNLDRPTFLYLAHLPLPWETRQDLIRRAKNGLALVYINQFGEYITDRDIEHGRKAHHNPTTWAWDVCNPNCSEALALMIRAEKANKALVQ